MRLSSLSNSFVFNLPSDFLTPEVVATYTPILEKNFVQYENVLDYINSSIISIDFPGLGFDVPNQVLPFGTKRAYYSSTPTQNIITPHELVVTFRSIDANLNYFLMFDIMLKHYTDTSKLYVNPFMFTAVDIFRDAIYVAKFTEIMFKGLDGQKFDYSSQKIEPKHFTATFHFNFLEIEFLLNKSKVLDLSGFPPNIVQRF